MAPSVWSNRATRCCAASFLDRCRQQALEERERLQRLAEIVAGGGQKAGFRQVGKLRRLLGGLQGFRGVLLFRDVGEGDDHPFHPVVMGAVGQHPAGEPFAASRFDLPLDRGRHPQHRVGIRWKRLVVGERIQVAERTADIRRDHVEQEFRGWREEADREIGVEKDRGDVRAVKDVLQIVGCGALTLQGFMKLAVEGRQFLIEGLQLLLRGQQLLVGGLILLVDR